MAKKRTLNEYRQTKEYKLDPVQQVLAQQIEELAEKDHLNKVHNKLWGEDYTEKDLQEGIKEMVDKQIDPEMNPSKYTKDELEQAKELIVNKITHHFHDVMFEMVNEEMNKSYVFQSEQYLTQAGYDEFEEAWFEFYHEHHGDILYQVMKNITN